jgi:hypothetical protein
MTALRRVSGAPRPGEPVRVGRACFSLPVYARRPGPPDAFHLLGNVLF